MGSRGRGAESQGGSHVPQTRGSSPLVGRDAETAALQERVGRLREQQQGVERIVFGRRFLELEQRAQNLCCIGDRGRILGKGGRTIGALRGFLEGVAARIDREVVVEIVD